VAMAWMARQGKTAFDRRSTGGGEDNNRAICLCYYFG
jgi:hypothetical protein